MAVQVPLLAAQTPDKPASPVMARESALVLFNEKAGSVTAGDRDALQQILSEHGFAHVEIIDTVDLTPRALKSARNHDVFIVLGGDGTARAAAEHAPPDGPPLMLLPGGTLNVLPRALYGELPWREALAAALDHGVIKRITHGYANGEPFYVAAIFGAPTLLARAREAVREGRLMTAMRRLRVFVKRSFSHSIRGRADDGPVQKAEAIGVLCPSYSGAIEGEDLEWVRLDPKHLLDLARVSVRALWEGWRNDPSVESQRCRRGDIVSLGVIPAVLDGEPKTFLRRVRITFKHRGPRVIALPVEMS